MHSLSAIVRSKCLRYLQRLGVALVYPVTVNAFVVYKSGGGCKCLRYLQRLGVDLVHLVIVNAFVVDKSGGGCKCLRYI